MTPEEGNAWYRRNKEKLGREDPVSDIIDRLGFQPQRVLEIGCANGWRLARLHEKYNCAVTGVDISVEAIADGKNLFPEIGDGLWRGKFPHFRLTPEFDLIICGFFLYLAERESLLRIVYEIDRLLANKGILIIHDFYSKTPYVNQYAHDRKMLCYKQDYGQLFISNPVYGTLWVAFRGTETPEPKSDDDRVVVHVLGKNCDAWPIREARR